MNRPTRIAFVEFGIVLILAIFLSVKGYAQDQRLAQLRKGYQECVYDAVASQIGAGQTNNASATVELAFQSCATEEQAIRAHVSSYRQILVTAGPVRRRRLWADGQRV